MYHGKHKSLIIHLRRCWFDLGGCVWRSLFHLLLRFLCLRVNGPELFWYCTDRGEVGRVWWAGLPLRWAWPRSRGEERFRGRGEARWTSCSSISWLEAESLLLLVTGPSESLLMDSVSELRSIGDNKLALIEDKSEKQWQLYHLYICLHQSGRQVALWIQKLL